MEALLRVLGSDPEQRAADRRTQSPNGSDLGRLPQDRRRARGRISRRRASITRPPGAPFETLDELGRVLGMTPALLRRAATAFDLVRAGRAEPGRPIRS